MSLAGPRNDSSHRFIYIDNMSIRFVYQHDIISYDSMTHILTLEAGVCRGRGTLPPPPDDLHTSKGRRHHIHTQSDADATLDATESRYQEFVRRALTRDSEKKRQSVSQSVSQSVGQSVSRSVSRSVSQSVSQSVKSVSQSQITVFIMLMTS